jgi:hypothetical protein
MGKKPGTGENREGAPSKSEGTRVGVGLGPWARRAEFEPAWVWNNIDLPLGME